MSNIILIEADRVLAKSITGELGKKAGVKVFTAVSADQAIQLADKHKPDLVISELSLPSHSASEFMYEFRTYEDWRQTPLIIYSSIQLDDSILNSNDWEYLNIAKVLYKPDVSLKSLAYLSEQFLDK